MPTNCHPKKFVFFPFFQSAAAAIHNVISSEAQRRRDMERRAEPETEICVKDIILTHAMHSFAYEADFRSRGHEHKKKKY